MRVMPVALQGRTADWTLGGWGGAPQAWPVGLLEQYWPLK